MPPVLFGKAVYSVCCALTLTAQTRPDLTHSPLHLVKNCYFLWYSHIGLSASSTIAFISFIIIDAVSPLPNCFPKERKPLTWLALFFFESAVPNIVTNKEELN